MLLVACDTQWDQSVKLGAKSRANTDIYGGGKKKKSLPPDRTTNLFIWTQMNMKQAKLNTMREITTTRTHAKSNFKSST